MWTQLYQQKYDNWSSKHVILIELPLIEAIKFIFDKYTDSRQLFDTTVEIKNNRYSVYCHSSLYNLTRLERNVASIKNFEREEPERSVLYHHKKERIILDKKWRYISLKKYLDSPAVEVYYKADVDSFYSSRSK